MDSLGSILVRFFRFVAHIASFECFLTTRKKRANGGAIVLARSVLSSLVVFALAVLIKSSLSCQLCVPSLTNLDPKLVTWFGAIWVAIYFGLYTRFASQWTYIANLYNQIKAAEIGATARLAGNKDATTRKVVTEKLAEWKAAFVEDAENVHLATKKSIVAVVWYWLREDDVKEAYLTNVPGGECRYCQLKCAVDATVERMGGLPEPRSQGGRSRK
jgi:hypothetical protein